MDGSHDIPLHVIWRDDDRPVSGDTVHRRNCDPLEPAAKDRLTRNLEFRKKRKLAQDSGEADLLPGCELFTGSVWASEATAERYLDAETRVSLCEVQAEE